MIGRESREVERKTIAILRVLNDCPEPLGGRIIARRLSDLGIDLGERAVRYHLKLMDQQGLTRPIGKRDGRTITPLGQEELDSALVGDRVGLIATRMEMLAYQSSFDVRRGAGAVPVNVSLFPEADFAPAATAAINEVCEAGFCVSDRLAVVRGGGRLGETPVPEGRVGVATVSNILIVSVLLKAGIPVDLRFGGILQIREGQPLRFVNLIEYGGSSLDPSEIFVSGRMTSAGRAAREGNGHILASFCELPSVAWGGALEMIRELDKKVRGLLKLGRPGETVCEIPVAPNRVGMVLVDGLNPVAAAVEAGIEVTNQTMSGVIDFSRLESFRAPAR